MYLSIVLLSCVLSYSFFLLYTSKRTSYQEILTQFHFNSFISFCFVSFQWKIIIPSNNTKETVASYNYCGKYDDYDDDDDGKGKALKCIKLVASSHIFFSFNDSAEIFIFIRNTIREKFYLVDQSLRSAQKI